jgi:hypothetical protein
VHLSRLVQTSWWNLLPSSWEQNTRQRSAMKAVGFSEMLVIIPTTRPQIPDEKNTFIYGSEYVRPPDVYKSRRRASWRWRQYAPRKRWSLYTNICNIISHKTWIVVQTAWEPQTWRFTTPRLRTGRSGFRIPVKTTDVCLVQKSRPALGHTRPPLQWVLGFFLGVNRPGSS